MAKKPQKLDKFERSIEKSLGTNTWKSASPEELAKHVLMAKKFVEATKKQARVNFRISEMHLHLLKKKAAEEGVPYQTFLTIILDKYLMNKLVETKAAKKKAA